MQTYFRLPILTPTFLVILALVCSAVYGLSFIELRARKLSREYELDEMIEVLSTLTSAQFAKFRRNDSIWRVAGAVSNLDRKRNAGATELVNRTRMSVVSGLPNYCPLKTNVSVHCLINGRNLVAVLPDLVLTLRGGVWAVGHFAELQSALIPYSFVEAEQLPSDATVSEHRWEHENANGQPDRRFRSNRKLPVCSYSSMSMTDNARLNEVIISSRSDDDGIAFGTLIISMIRGYPIIRA